MAQTNTLRIALLTKYMEWGGGLDFLRYLANGLVTLKNARKLTISLVIDEEFKRSDIHQKIIDLFIADTPLVEELIYYDGTVEHMESKLQEFNVNVVLPVNADLGADFAIPWMSYIPDFQHKYLYKNFTSKECFIREVAFSARLRDSKVVLVNSHSVKNDIIRFYPWIDHDSIFALPFSPNASDEYLTCRPYLLNQLSNLPEKYFLISNQFWIHKNHKTAFKALAEIGSDLDVSLVCTGLMEDYRNPDYLNELRALINDLGLTDRIHLLGHIPKRQQIELMKSAIAVIQPTSFEGGPGGGAVYDAVSLGVPVIVSDIEINLEVMGRSVYFFKSEDEQSLASQMTHVIHSPGEKISKEQLIEDGQHNLKKLGECLFQSISYTLEAYGERCS